MLSVSFVKNCFPAALGVILELILGSADRLGQLVPKRAMPVTQNFFFFMIVSYSYPHKLLWLQKLRFNISFKNIFLVPGFDI